MIKIILLILLLADSGFDWNPLDFLGTLDRRALCHTLLTRMNKCDPQLGAMLRKHGMQQKLTQECIRSASKKDIRKGRRCVRIKNCKRFMKCLMR